MMRRLALLIACAGVLGVGGQLVSAGTGELIDETLAGRHGLTRAWYAQVQMDRSRGRITHLVLDEGMLFVQTSQAMVQALDAETGRAHWAVQVGTPGYPDMPVGAYGDYVAAINGSTLYILNRYDGKLLWQKKLEGSPGAGPGLSNRQVYVPLADGLVYTYPLKPVAKPVLKIEGEEAKKPEDAAGKTSTKSADGGKLPARLSAAGGRTSARPPAAGAAEAGQTPAEAPSAEAEQQRRESLRLSQEFLPGLACPSTGQAFTRPLVTTQKTGEESVAWTTSRGYLYMGRLFENHFSAMYRLSTGGPMSTEPTFLPPDANVRGDTGVIYGASEDGFVYAIRETNGNLLWRFSTGEPIVERAGVIGVRIYVPTQTEGMYCLNAKTGEQVWWAPAIRRFIAASRERLYTIDQVGQMAVLNAQTGARLDTLDMTRFPLRLTNDRTDRLYLASPAGLVQCLHEIDAPQPIQHREVLAQERAKVTEEKPAPVVNAPTAAGQENPPAPGEHTAVPRNPTVQPPKKAATQPKDVTKPPKKAASPRKGAQPAEEQGENPFN